jgi:hypothetical protein
MGIKRSVIKTIPIHIAETEFTKKDLFNPRATPWISFPEILDLFLLEMSDKWPWINICIAQRKILRLLV